MQFGECSPRENRASGAVVDAAMCVHTALGPGLLEGVYASCLAHELMLRGLSVEREVQVPLFYRGLEVDCPLRVDLMVDGCVLVEIKSVARLAPPHMAQLLSYLKLADRRLGLLLNFNVDRMKHGIKRVIMTPSASCRRASAPPR